MRWALLILAAGCAAALLVLALTRTDHARMTEGPPPKAPAAADAAKPAAAKASAPKPEPAKVEEEEEVDAQVAEDAAAVGMTTRKPPRVRQAASELPKEEKRP